MNDKKIGERITELRLAHGESEYKLSLEIGQARSYIGMVVAEKLTPSLPALANICRYYGITLSEFFNAEFTEEAEMFIRKFNMLTDEDRAVILRTMDGLLCDEQVRRIKKISR